MTNSKAFPHAWLVRRDYHEYASDNPVGSTNKRVYGGNATDTFSGGDNPHWREFIKQHRDATTPASGSRTTISLANGTAYRRRKYFGNPNVIIYEQATGHLYPGFPIPPSPDGQSESHADTQARLKFLQQYRSRRTAFQGGTFFGELRETLEMLRSPTKALRKGIDQYAKAARRAASKAGRLPKKRNSALVDTYLEYSYGWRPLFGDIQDAAELVRHSQRTYLEDMNAEYRENTAVDLGTFTEQENALAWKGQQRTEYSVSVRYKGAVLAETPEPSFAEFVGFSPSNFVPTVWNLIPYSFLVDYFTNIGTVLDSMSLGRVNLAWGVRTVRKESRFVASGFTANMTPDQYLLSQYVISPDYVASKVSFVRTGLAAEVEAGLSDISFRLPGCDSPWKWLNIAGLATAARLRNR